MAVTSVPEVARRGYADVGATMYVFEDEQYENRVFVRALDRDGSMMVAT